MDIVQCIIALLAGCGVFIAGMNMMSDGLENATGSGLKKLLGKIISNRFSGVAVGAAVTALIQSSSATSVMTIGLVNAGVMTLAQSASVIMGTNIGTTVTGLIVSLSSLGISTYATLLAFIGVMMMLFKKQGVKTVGGILCGLGLLFVGLDLMSGAFGNDAVKGFFEVIFVTIDFPLLLILIGAIFTALVQSSSAATGLVIIMVGKGAIPVTSALFIILGSNIGTCVTALLACMGTGTNAKRTAVIHLTFNIIGTIVFTAVLWPLSDVFVNLLQSLVATPEMQIAWFHVVFNVTTTLLLLPFVNLLVKFSKWVIKDKQEDTSILQLRFVDERLLKTPSIALMQVKKEIEYMASLSKQNLIKSFEEVKSQSGNNSKEIIQVEELINFTNNSLTKYLVELSSVVDSNTEKIVGGYFHVVNDIERIGDHAENFLELSQKMKSENLEFSPAALDELEGMCNKLGRMFDLAIKSLDDGRYSNILDELNTLENEVDDLKNHLSTQHFIRLSEGNCKVELSAFFHEIVSGLERIGDHLVNVGYSVMNPTGSQKKQ